MSAVDLEVAGAWVSADPMHLLEGSSRYRKKTTIRARQVNAHFRVRTLEGIMEGKPGDWLAVGIKGELYPIDKDIFTQTYEAVES